MRILMIALWKNRKNEKFTNELCARLPYLSISKATLDQVEFYLPQLAHMVVHLESELPMEAMEQFVLLLSQSSVHFALQFFWIIYAALDENRPKRNGNPRTFARCAQLLLALEQCFVHGSPAAKVASELLTRNSISKTEMDEILSADRRFFAAQSSLEACSSEAMAMGEKSSLNNHDSSGWLFKKGGGTRKMGRRNWTLRWCRIENRILLVFTKPSDSYPRTAFSLDRAQIRVVENKKHPFYFELHHEFSETKMQFAAQSQEELVAWIGRLQRHAAVPEPPSTAASGTSPGKTGSTGNTLARMSFAMRSFILQSSGGNLTALTSPTSASTDTTEGDAPTITPLALPSAEPERVHTMRSSTAAGDGDRTATMSRTTETTIGGCEASSTAVSECFPLQYQSPSSLSREQQRRYEFFSGMIHFVKAITDVSESLRRTEPAKRKALLRPRLEALKIPPLAYIPLCKSTDVYCNVLSVFSQEGRVFSTNERAPCMIYFETEEHEDGDDVSKALFTQLYTTQDDEADGDEFLASKQPQQQKDDDEDEDVVALDSNVEILKYLDDSPKSLQPQQPRRSATSIPDGDTATRASNSTTMSPFLEKLLGDEARKQRIEKIFGELTFSATQRLQRESEWRCVSTSKWRLCCLMAKSYDDLRQEVLVMQLISYFGQIFRAEKLELWLHPYRILSTGASTGLLEVVCNTISLDGIKKTSGFKNLRTHFEDIYGRRTPDAATDSVTAISASPADGADDDLLEQAKLNFVHSLAAYSIVCYILAIKDRHNGNILLDIEGHIVHIDFGFFLGRAPGGSFSFETAPFKLTTEMVDVLGGRHSSNFKYFTELCVQGARAARKHAETIYTLVEVMSLHSKLPCFTGNPAAHLAGLRERLFLNVPEEKVEPLILSMIERSYDHFGTNKYDQFQVYSNGIAK
uniref:1-phosphatidylinositol 4-kinase n=1 Tax=Globisporangium ultimum (strain ATCC 200006 / CBS 805.95 / DAOM BR144) TaxID=431595 RepID=K3WPJ9_GLOUD